MIRAFVLVGAALSLLAPGPVDPPPDPPVGPPAGSVTVDIVSQYGSGCPADHVWVAMHPANEQLSVGYTEFMAAVGPHVPITDFRKNCQVTLNVDVPSGYTYAITGVDYPGWAALADGATGRLRASFHFAAAPVPALSTYSFTGPMADSWRIPEVVDPQALAWAPCDAPSPLVLRTELRVLPVALDGSIPDSVLAIDYVDGPPVEFHLAWRAC